MTVCLCKKNMGRRPCCAKEGLNKGAWTANEDQILKNYVTIHGEGKWRDLPHKAGIVMLKFTQIIPIILFELSQTLNWTKLF